MSGKVKSLNLPAEFFKSNFVENQILLQFSFLLYILLNILTTTYSAKQIKRTQ